MVAVATVSCRSSIVVVSRSSRNRVCRSSSGSRSSSFAITRPRLKLGSKLDSNLD